jgi:hypothetical protein
MNFLKENWLAIIIVIVVGYLLIGNITDKVKPDKPVISIETVKKIDSLQDIVKEVSIAKARDEEAVKRLEEEKTRLLEELAGVKPKFSKSLSDYKIAGPEKKNELYNTEFQKRKKEMEASK